MAKFEKNKKNHKNRLGDKFFHIRTDDSSEVSSIAFDFECDNYKLKWAQELFLQMPFVVHAVRNEVIVVTSLKPPTDATYILRKICEYWEKHLPSTPMWNWNNSHISEFFYHHMVKTQQTDSEPLQLYSYGRVFEYVSMLNLGHASKVHGKICDGISFPLTKKTANRYFQAKLDEVGMNFEDWKKGKSFPTIPLPIAATMLSRSIDILESEETAIASCLFSAWRKNPENPTQWFATATRPWDIVEGCHLRKTNTESLMMELSSCSMENVPKLPWKRKSEFNSFCRKVSNASMSILFIQSGYRFAELNSVISTETKQKNGIFLAKQSMDKTMGGLRVYRPLASLSWRVANINWGLSFLDYTSQKIPLFHRTWRATQDNLVTHQNTGKSYKHSALLTQLNRFYKNEILPLIPEAAEYHPHLSFHQFRHTFAEFVFRRFDEDVHESLREHFAHLSDRSTRIYEEAKLSSEVLSTLEMEYLYELVGKAAEGKLDKRFWGPAFKRLKNEIGKIKFASIEEAEIYYDEVMSQIERFAVFEWGFCVLFHSSKTEAKCHDPVTGLPDVEGLASPSRCSHCPNNMGNSIQTNNMVRIAIAHSDIGERHPIKAIGKLSMDIAERITRRIGEV